MNYIIADNKYKYNLVQTQTHTIEQKAMRGKKHGRKERRGIIPNAKQKVKIAEKMWPMMTEATRQTTLLILSMKFPREPNKGH